MFQTSSQNNSSRKKVLIFVPEFPRLTETFIQREISKLIELGNLDIVVFSIKKASGELYPNVKEHVAYARLDLLSLILGWFYIFFTSPIKIFSLYLEFLRMNDRGKKSFVGKTFFYCKSIGYAYLFSKEAPDHIHAHFMSWPSTVAMISSDLLNIPYSISAHALDVTVDGEYFVQKAKSAEFISICNKFAYKYFLDHIEDIDYSNVLLQYHGVDLRRASENLKAVDKNAKFLIFNGGSRLVEKKGQEYLIKAADILKKEGVDFELHIAGPGPLYDDLMSLIKELDLSDRVFIHGEGKGVPFSSVLAYLNAADLVVQSNVNLESGDADGIPTFVIESALAGKPIVTTDAGSMTDLIIDDQTGALVPQRDSESLAVAIKAFLQEPEKAQEMAQAAKEKALLMFDLQKNASELEGLLLE